jgi:hypothetical protein
MVGDANGDEQGKLQVFCDISFVTSPLLNYNYQVNIVIKYVKYFPKLPHFSTHILSFVATFLRTLLH